MNDMWVSPLLVIMTLSCITTEGQQHGNKCKPSGCLDGWKQFRSGCYRLTTKNMSWHLTHEACLSRNSNLTSITSLEEHMFMHKLGVSNFWIGLNDINKEKKFEWSDGQPLDYLYGVGVKKNIPQRDCVLLKKTSENTQSFWEASECSFLALGICRKKALINEICANSPLGMESGAIPSKSIKAGSQDSSKVDDARLGNPGQAWCGRRLNIHLGSTHRICGVATQGGGDSEKYVKSYKITLINDGKRTSYDNLAGNTDAYGVVKHEFDQRGIEAKTLEFEGNDHHECMKIEFYGKPLPGPTLAPPTKPQNLALHIVGEHFIQVQWHQELISVICGYSIMYNTSTNSSWLGNIIVGANVSSVNITDLILEANVTYCVSVSAFNQDGDGLANVQCLLVPGSPQTDEGFTDWSLWSVCSVTCGGGQQNRARSCTNPPPQNGGAQCAGELSETVNCNTGGCPDCLAGWSHFEGHCYLYVESKHNMLEARNHCFNRNAYLVDITSEKENNFVHTAVNANSWIGLKRFGDTFRWEGQNKTLGLYENWQEGMPDKVIDCVTMSRINGTWQSTSCNNKRHYTCKRSVFKRFPCVDRDLGVERGLILSDQITPNESSPRLGVTYDSWCTQKPDKYLQVDLLRLHQVCAIATQGHHISGLFVKQYELQFSRDGIIMEWYKDDLTNQKKVFEANHNYFKVKKITLRKGFQTTVVRFIPVSWQDKACMRIELYGELIYQEPLYSPSNITVHSINSTALKVMWRGVPANGPIDAYKITATLLNSTASHEIHVKGDENQTIFTNVDIFSTYIVCVTPRNFFGLGESGCVETSTDEGVPNASPTDITIRNVTSSSCFIDWSPMHAVLGYRVQSHVNSTPFNFSTIVTSCTCVQLSNLELNKLYCVRVSAFTKAGIGKGDECVYLKIAWGNGSGSTTTAIVATTTVNTPSISTTRGITSTVRPAPNNVTITYKTPAISSTVHPIISVPEKFHTNVTVRSLSSTSLLVSWQPVSPDRVNGVLLGYRVIYTKDGLLKARRRRDVVSNENGGMLTFNATVRSAVLSGLQTYTSYCVKVLAFTKKGNGEPNDCIVGETAEEAPPVAPHPVMGSMIDGTFAWITWGAVPGQLLGYVVFFGYNKTLVNSSVQTLVLNDIQLKPDTCVQVAAFNRAGYGRRSNCTYVIETQLPAPNAVTASIKKSPSEVDVTWEKLPGGKSLGVLGYKVRFYAVRENGKRAVNTSRQTVTVENINATILGNLRPFTTYAVQVAAYTFGKDGNYSDAVDGATCNCDKDFSGPTNSSSTRDPATNSSDFGGLASIISNLVTDSCGSCGDYGTTTVKYFAKSSQDSSLEYPVSRTSNSKTDGYSTFIPVIEIPGVLIITRKTEGPAVLSGVATNSILEAWPLFLLTILTSLLAGMVIWVLDRNENPGNFPHQFIKGAGEGLWWAVITMTTLGYGDRVPKSVLAKAFAMIWFLVGLVIFALFMGVLSAALTVTVVRKNVDSYRKPANTKVAVVEGSMEHQVSLQSLSSKVTIGNTYPSLNKLVEALKSGKENATLVDMYVPIKRQDLFNGTWFEVSRLLEVKIAHGVLLKGDAKRLEHEIRNLIVKNNVQTNYLKSQGNPDEKEGAPAPVQENSILIFDPESPFFQKTLVVSSVALGAAFFCGLLYQLKLTVSRKRTVQDSAALIALQKKKYQEEMRGLVKEFYTSFHENVTKMRKQHLAQLRSLAINRKNAC